MKKHEIGLSSLTPEGKVALTPQNGGLLMISEGFSKRIPRTMEEKKAKKPIQFEEYCARVPGAYALPFKIDLTLTANSRRLKLWIGKGYIAFIGTFFRSYNGNEKHQPEGGGIHRADVLTGKPEPPKYDFDANLPLNETATLSVIYGSKAMWVEINGRPCYVAKNAPYMAVTNKERLEIALSCDRGVELELKSLAVTEYENDEPVIGVPELSAYEWFLQSLPRELREEAVKTDQFLMESMKRVFKFKKSIDKEGVLAYISPCGLQYRLRRISFGETHYLSWDQFNKVFAKLGQTDPAFAEKMFANVRKNITAKKCQQCDSISCCNMKTIEYNGKSKKACAGAVQFEWTPSAFEDVRKLIQAAGEVV
ncbi:MAG: hypothetical protein FWG31_10160 [Oscillospiraceae bacterium]|nr:hypothetical protein [Oscillospiraceae bacterium]